jgi:hypothetical protein
MMKIQESLKCRTEKQYRVIEKSFAPGGKVFSLIRQISTVQLFVFAGQRSYIVECSDARRVVNDEPGSLCCRALSSHPFFEGFLWSAKSRATQTTGG